MNHRVASLLKTIVIVLSWRKLLGIIKKNGMGECVFVASHTIKLENIETAKIWWRVFNVICFDDASISKTKTKHI